MVDMDLYAGIALCSLRIDKASPDQSCPGQTADMRNTRTSRLALLLTSGLAAGVVLVSCGSDSTAGSTTQEDALSSDTSPAAQDQNALAASLLLSIRDFPPGWEENPDPDGGSSRFLPTCPSLFGTASSNRGLAHSGDFSYGASLVHFGQTLAVFRTKEEARATIPQAQVVLDCEATAISNGAFDDASSKFGKATLARLSLGSAGDDIVAYRLAAPSTVKLSNSTMRLTKYFYVVVVAQGRVAFVLGASTVDLLSDTEMLARLARDGAAKAVAIK
jgi:hypothetical protein